MICSGSQPNASSPELDILNANDNIASEASRGIADLEAYLADHALVAA